MSPIRNLLRRFLTKVVNSPATNPNPNPTPTPILPPPINIYQEIRKIRMCVEEEANTKILWDVLMSCTCLTTTSILTYDWLVRDED